MPVYVKDFSWHESDGSVFLSVPMRGIKPGSTDLFATDEYLKISFGPYIFEAFLPATVDVNCCRCLFSDGQVFLELPKIEKGKVWGTISKRLSKDDAKRLRQEAVLRKHALEAESTSRKLELAAERRREATNESLKQDENRRRTVAKIKEQTKREFMNEVEKDADSWNCQVEDSDEDDDEENKGTELAPGERCSVEKSKDAQVSKTAKPKAKPKPRQTTFVSSVAERAARERQRSLPPPREPAQIIVTFTKTKKAEDGTEETVTEEAREILLQRGAEAFAGGDVAEAIKIFTRGSQEYPTHAAFLNNRSACYLRVGHLHGALQDATGALDLLNKTPTSDNARERAKAHLRRADALLKLDLPDKALVEMEAAANLRPEDESIRNDMAKVKLMMARRSQGEENEDEEDEIAE